MATAREQMLEEVMKAMSAQEASDEAKAELRQMLNRYRVQTKPNNAIPEGVTARDALGDRIMEVWGSKSEGDPQQRLSDIIDTFRMQNKAKPGQKKKAPKKVAKPLPKMDLPPEPKPQPKPKPEHRAPRSEPAVRGGVRKRGRTRSECPKCKSMGVVLASSYSGDDYFSCVYCGWQAYKPADENDPNASLAARLLGKSTKD